MRSIKLIAEMLKLACQVVGLLSYQGTYANAQSEEEVRLTHDFKSTPKGWYHPSGLFVNVNWPVSVIQETSSYRPYLSTFGHEQVHYLQHVGTSYGQLLADLEDMWVTHVLESVHFGLRRSMPTTLSLRAWAEKESSSEVAEVLSSAIALHEKCSRIAEVAMFGGSVRVLREFTTLYQQVLMYQMEHESPIWYVDKRTLPIDIDQEILKEGGYIGGHLLMECAAVFHQAIAGGPVSQEMRDTVDFDELPPGIQEGLTNVEGVEESSLRLDGVLQTDYMEPLRLIGGYLPEQSDRLLPLLFIILDLSLMPPVGRFNSTATSPPTFADLLPGIRLIRAAEAISRLGIAASPFDFRMSSFNVDYLQAVDAICVDSHIRWPQPQWIAMRTCKLSIRADAFGDRAISQLQLLAAKMRRDQPGAFALPRAPLIDDMRIPVVYYTDGVRVGCSRDEQMSLMARYFRKLCAQSWVLGRRPKIPELPGLSEGYEESFRSLFGFPIHEVHDE